MGGKETGGRMKEEGKGEGGKERSRVREEVYGKREKGKGEGRKRRVGSCREGM